MHLPWQHFRPASTMWNLDESIMRGSLEMSGSGMSMLRNFFMAYSPSSRPSSMLTSMTCAPDSACARAISSAVVDKALRVDAERVRRVALLGVLLYHVPPRRAAHVLLDDNRRPVPLHPAEHAEEGLARLACVRGYVRHGYSLGAHGGTVNTCAHS